MLSASRRCRWVRFAGVSTVCSIGQVPCRKRRARPGPLSGAEPVQADRRYLETSGRNRLGGGLFSSTAPQNSIASATFDGRPGRGLATVLQAVVDASLTFSAI